MQKFLPILTTALIAAAASGVTVLASNVSSLNLGNFAPLAVAALGALAHWLTTLATPAPTPPAPTVNHKDNGRSFN
jgi:hypothetical protein